MPNKQAAIKALRQAKKRAARNYEVKVNLKTTIKKGRKAIEGGEKEDAKKLISQAVKLLDKAAQKGVIKKNNAARKKSRLMKKINALEKKPQA